MGIFKKFLTIEGLDLSRQIFLSNFGITPLPYKVTFALTYKCQLKCKYCMTWDRPEKKELSLNEIKLIIGSMKNLRWLHFTGGEIFSRPDIGDILDFVIEHKRLAVLTLPTNGTNSQNIVNIVKRVSKRMKYTRMIITCSLDGRKEVHDKLRGVEGVYDECMETFRQLRIIPGVDAYIGMTVSQDNYRELPLLLPVIREKIPDFGFNEFHLNFVGRSFFYNNETNDSEKLINIDIYEYINKMRRDYRKNSKNFFLEDKYFILMEDYLKDRKIPIGCSAARGSCFIDAYGDVYPCIHYKIKLGNLEISDYNFKKFWKTYPGKNKLRDSIDNKECFGCWTPCEAYPTILSNLFYVTKK